MTQLTRTELDAMEAHVRETEAADAPTRNVYSDVLALIEHARYVEAGLAEIEVLVGPMYGSQGQRGIDGDEVLRIVRAVRLE